MSVSRSGRGGASRPAGWSGGARGSAADDAHVRRLEQVRLRIAAGADPGDVDGLGERAATVLRVAGDAGAPLLAALDAAVAADEDVRRAERATTVAAAQGRAVARGLLLAPLGLVPLLGRLFGVDLVAYHRTPLGLATGGLALLLLAAGWTLARRAVGTVTGPGRPVTRTRRRIRAALLGLVVVVVVHPWVGLLVGTVLAVRARGDDPAVDPAVADAAELTATALGGGWSVPAALRLTADELPTLAPALRRLAYDLEHGHVGTHPPGVDRLADVLTTAAAVGAPVGPTLRQLAADVRADELARVLAAAERLPVRLTFPTALCLLPGTLLLIGAPIVATGLEAVGA